MKKRQALGQGSELHVWEENEACVEHGTRKVLSPHEERLLCSVNTGLGEHQGQAVIVMWK